MKEEWVSARKAEEIVRAMGYKLKSRNSLLHNCYNAGVAKPKEGVEGNLINKIELIKYYRLLLNKDNDYVILQNLRDVYGSHLPHLFRNVTSNQILCKLGVKKVRIYDLLCVSTDDALKISDYYLKQERNKR